MGIEHFVFAVNKMDLVNYSQERFDEIKKDIDALAEELGLANDNFYLPIQRVCRPSHEFRGFQGQIEAGTVSKEKFHPRQIWIIMCMNTNTQRMIKKWTSTTSGQSLRDTVE